MKFTAVALALYSAVPYARKLLDVVVIMCQFPYNEYFVCVNFSPLFGAKLFF